jgi:transposase-like protein
MSDQISKLAAELKKARKSDSRKKYPRAIKEKVVDLLNEGVAVKDLAAGLGIHATTLAGWKNKTRLENRSQFHQATVLDDNPEIKVTVISGLKLSDLSKLF